MNADIRRLTIDDFDDIHRIWSDSGLPTKPGGRDSRAMIEKEMQKSVVAYFGLFDNNKMIGVGIANFDGRRGWVNRVAIDPDQRGKKLASKIIDVCEQFLYDSGAVVICALIEEENSPSMACFAGSGYTAEKEIIYWTKRRSAED